MKNIGAPLAALLSSRLLDQVRERIRYLHCSIRTEQACVHWVRAFVRFHELNRHASEMSAASWPRPPLPTRMQPAVYAVR
jgi:hypothetical protein